MNYKAIVFGILILASGTSLSAQINLNKAKDKLKDKSNEATISKTDQSNMDTNTNQEETPTNTPQQEEGASKVNAHQPYASYTGEIPPATHKDNYDRTVGTILFSKKPITYNEEDKAAITNTFKAGDQVFGMGYLADSKINLGFERGYSVWIRDAEDGRGYSASHKYGAGPYKTKADGTNNGNQKYYDLDVFVGYEDAYDRGLTAALLERLALHIKAAPQSNFGTNAKKIHKLKVEISNNSGITVAEGVFYYDLTEGEDKVFAMNQTHKQAALKEFKLPASKRNDPALASKLEQVMKAAGVNVQKVIFSTADWGMIRHEISGAVLRRSIWAYIVYKNEQGECHYDEVQFTEDFVGNDFNGIIKKAGYGTDNGQILCENINK
ncbi:MAG: hypothetical protein JJT94_06635 [Bernardetiaceae bacterium]|nr:hypothetical protein [Bernardetiaceae bacterium]